jgi:hypothetical protein
MGAAPNNGANNTPMTAARQIGHIELRENFPVATPHCELEYHVSTDRVAKLFRSCFVPCFLG